jgi:hypothetical protein
MKKLDCKRERNNISLYRNDSYDLGGLYYNTAEFHAFLKVITDQQTVRMFKSGID